MNSDRYNKLGVFFQKKFGKKLTKLCIDGGFTCPNRDGKCGTGGCIFCYQPERVCHIDTDHIRNQVNNLIVDAKEEQQFIVYFQNYSGTYASIAELREKYDAALSNNRIVALAIATRPDCITHEIADLLYEYSQKYYVYVEMGLQTSNDATARLINRGYSTLDFVRAVKILEEKNINVVAHLIFGLPGEDDQDIAKTISFINAQRIVGVKIHSLYVTKQTKLCTLYEMGEYTPQLFDEYIKRLAYAITHLKRDIIIHRITGDCERGKLVAPAWNNRKKLIRNALERVLEANDWRQGCLLLS